MASNVQYGPAMTVMCSQFHPETAMAIKPGAAFASQSAGPYNQKIRYSQSWSARQFYSRPASKVYSAIISQSSLAIAWQVSKACAAMVSQPGPARTSQVKPWAAMGSHGKPPTYEQA